MNHFISIQTSELVQKNHKSLFEVSGDTESQPQAIGGGTYAKSMPNCVAFWM